jgi:hypothetical protein
MKFKNYLANVEKVFKFRIKTLFPLEDELMDLLEKALQKYRPNAVSKPFKTMFTTNPLGFTGEKCVEVYMCDIELTVPVTTLVLQHDLRDSLGLHKDAKDLKVFGESQQDLEGDMEVCCDEDKECGPAKLENEKYEEVEESKFEDFYGDDYNSKFLAYVKKVEAERRAKTGRGETKDAKHPITKWADQPKAEPKDSDTEQKK